MEIVSSRVLKTIEILRTKPMVVISSIDHFDFETLRIYIDAYINGLDSALDTNLKRVPNFEF